MNDTLLIIITLTSSFLIVYHHLGYPLILQLLQKGGNTRTFITSTRGYSTSVIDNELPTITIVIPAYNEQFWIADKIRNLAALDYPDNRLKVIIACDGCSDDTKLVATQTSVEPECDHLAIEICDFKPNRGKVWIINEVMQYVDSELVALSDVTALISIDALLIAAERFKDPDIGVLTGHYRLLNPGSVGEAAYWHYQSKIKSSEASLGSTLGAHGAFYLFRRALFQPLATDTINDDFILPMKIVASGFRADYEDRIHALELEKANENQDHHRRRRIAAGNIQQIIRLKRLFLPRYGGVAFAFISCKGLRVLMPFLMIITLISSMLLATSHLMFMLLTAVQLFVYLLVSWQLLVRPKHASRLTRILTYIVGGHVAGLIGTLGYLLGLERGRWQRIKQDTS